MGHRRGAGRFEPRGAPRMASSSSGIRQRVVKPSRRLTATESVVTERMSTAHCSNFSESSRRCASCRFELLCSARCAYSCDPMSAARSGSSKSSCFHSDSASRSRPSETAHSSRSIMQHLCDSPAARFGVSVSAAGEAREARRLRVRLSLGVQSSSPWESHQSPVTPSRSPSRSLHSQLLPGGETAGQPLTGRRKKWNASSLPRMTSLGGIAPWSSSRSVTAVSSSASLTEVIARRSADDSTSSSSTGSPAASSSASTVLPAAIWAAAFFAASFCSSSWPTTRALFHCVASLSLHARSTERTDAMAASSVSSNSPTLSSTEYEKMSLLSGSFLRRSVSSCAIASSDSRTLSLKRDSRAKSASMRGVSPSMHASTRSASRSAAPPVPRITTTGYMLPMKP